MFGDMPDTFEMVSQEVGMVWRSRSVVDERLEFCRLAGLEGGVGLAIDPNRSRRLTF